MKETISPILPNLANNPTIDADFREMIDCALAYFAAQSQSKQTCHQCVVLKTAADEHTLFPFSASSVEELIEQSTAMFTEHTVPTVQKLICMWEGGALDVPCRAFTRMLCEMDPQNKQAKILLCTGQDSYSEKTLADLYG